MRKSKQSRQEKPNQMVSNKKNNRNNNQSKSSTTSSWFKVQNKRAMKSKQNKAFMKFQNEKNIEEVSKLDQNYDILRSKMINFNRTKEPKPFKNPIAASNCSKESDRYSMNDLLNDTIEKFNTK